MASETGLPKWPRILVTSSRQITREQVDLVLVRTADLQAQSHDDAWNAHIMDVFGLKPDPDGSGLPDFDSLDRARERFGVLELQYLVNDRIATSNQQGPSGWCDWDGRIYTDDMTAYAKWPTVAELTEEWQIIAGAFPFLSLNAQVIEAVWGERDIESYRPLAAWTVDAGTVDLHDTPGDFLLTEPADLLVGNETWERHQRQARKGDFSFMRGTTPERLREAAQRCLR